MSLAEVFATGCPEVLGRPSESRCTDCGERLTSRLEPAGPFLIHTPPRHDCQVRRRLEQERAAEAAARRQEWLDSPPAERIEEVMQRCNLPAFAPAPRGLAQVERRPRQAPALARLLEHRQAWLSGARPEKGLWLFGDSSAGKSYLLSALAFDLGHRTSRSALWWNVPRLCHQMQLSFDGRETRYEPTEIDRAELLVLDEVPPPHATAWSISRLYLHAQTAEEGHAGRRTQTIYVTSQYEPSKVAADLGCREDPERGTRLVNRLKRLCEVIQVRRER